MRFIQNFTEKHQNMNNESSRSGSPMLLKYVTCVNSFAVLALYVLGSLYWGFYGKNNMGCPKECHLNARPMKEGCGVDNGIEVRHPEADSGSNYRTVVKFTSSKSVRNKVVDWQLLDRYRTEMGKQFRVSTYSSDGSRTIFVPWEGQYMIIADLNFDPVVYENSPTCSDRTLVHACITIVNSTEPPICHRLKMQSCMSMNTVIPSIVHLSAGQGIRIQGYGFQSFYEATLQILYNGS